MNTDTPETDAVVFSPHVYWPDFARRLELERDEARQAIANLNQRLQERQESFQAQLIRIEDVWREKLREKDAQIAALREALSRIYLENIFDVTMREIAGNALSAPAPAVVPLDDVRPLIEAVKNTRHLRNTSFNRSTGKMDGIIVNSDLFWKLKDALAAITEKYQL